MTAFLTAMRGGALLVFVLFLVVYSARTRAKVRWWRSEYGRMIVSLVISIILLIGNGLVNAIWPGYPYRLQVTAVLLAILAVAGAWLVHVMVEALADRQQPPESSDGPENG